MYINSTKSKNLENCHTKIFILFNIISRINNVKQKIIPLFLNTIIKNCKLLQHNIIYPQEYNYILQVIILFILLLNLRFVIL